MGILDRFRLDGKVAVVTGAGQGIGRVFALALAEAGADVVVADVNDRTATLVADEVAARGRRSVSVHADIGVEAHVQAMVRAATADLGRLDILVNNANAGGPKDADWMGRNLKAVLRCSQVAAEAMRETGGGKIVNVASISGTVVNHTTAYCTAKAGLIMMTRCLAVELARDHIHVNSISPSYTLSPARRRDSVEMKAHIRSLHPIGWYQRPDDLCGTLIYLASAASDYVTGRDIIVDGGHTLNVWLAPPPRVTPPPVTPDQETESLRHDLDALGIGDDDNGVASE